MSTRLEDGAWRLCEKGGRTILYVSQTQYPDLEIAFPGRKAAQACAQELNENWWDFYKGERENTTDPRVQEGMLAVVHRHGGLTDEQMERLRAAAERSVA